MVSLVALIIMVVGDFVCSIYVLISNVRKHFLLFTVALATFDPQLTGRKMAWVPSLPTRAQALTHGMPRPAFVVNKATASACAVHLTRVHVLSTWICRHPEIEFSYPRSHSIPLSWMGALFFHLTGGEIEV